MRHKRKKQDKMMKLIKIIAEIFQYLDKDTHSHDKKTATIPN